LIRVGQNFRNSLPVLREQLRMPFGDMALSLLSELDLGFEVGARKPGHQGAR